MKSCFNRHLLQGRIHHDNIHVPVNGNHPVGKGIKSFMILPFRPGKFILSFLTFPDLKDQLMIILGQSFLVKKVLPVQALEKIRDEKTQ